MKYKNNFRNFSKGNGYKKSDSPQPKGLSVEVRNGDVGKALKLFKRKVQDSGILQELREREFYEKPTTRRNRKKAAGIARHKKRIAQEQSLGNTRKGYRR